MSARASRAGGPRSAEVPGIPIRRESACLASSPAESDSGTAAGGSDGDRSVKPWRHGNLIAYNNATEGMSVPGTPEDVSSSFSDPVSRVPGTVAAGLPLFSDAGAESAAAPVSASGIRYLTSGWVGGYLRLSA